MNTRIIAIIAAAAFVIGAGAGNASATPTVAAAPTLAPVVQPTPEVIVRTQTVSSTVEVTPQSCLDAIGYGRDIADWSSGMIDALMPVVDAMSGTITEQTAALVTAGDAMSALNAKYEGLPDDFNAAAAACQSH